jgi:hypothetical protein
MEGQKSKAMIFIRSIWQKINNWLIGAFLVIWPYIFLFPYVVPINGKYLRIGNDFYYLYYKYKLYFLALVNSAHFPLWSPSEASGFPFFSSPFGQPFYPINIPLALLYRITGGYTILDHQRFSVLGISIFSLGIYIWLRSLNLKLKPALYSSLIMAVSFILVNYIRFPNAIHSACWYPWIMYAMTKIASSTSRKKAILYGLLLVFSSYSLITAGYPYYLYYSLFLIFPYGVFILIPGLREKLFHIQEGSLRRTWSVFAIVGVLLIVFTSPYLIQLYTLLGQTFSRHSNNWSFSIFRLFGPLDSLGSLVYPISSYQEGWYHFGFIGFLLIIVFLFGKVMPRNKNSPKSMYNTVTKLVLVAWFLIITYISWGKESLLFAFLWRFLPGFSSLRQWGRFNIILVPILAWLVALAFQYFEEMIFNSERLSSPANLAHRRGIFVLSGAYGFVLVIQGLFIYKRYNNFFWGFYFLPHFQALLSFPFQMIGWQIPQPQQIHRFFMFMFVSLGFLAFLVCMFFLQRARKLKPVLVNSIFIVLFIISGFNEFIAGPWIWALGWENIPERSSINISRTFEDSFNTPRVNIYDSLSLDAVFNTGTFSLWYFDRYISFLTRAKDEPGPANIILGIVNGQKVYFSTSISPINFQAFLDDAGRFVNLAQVVSYNGDSLELTITAPEDGFVSFIDNWDPNWKATVDDQPENVLLLFGTFKSVEVPVGTHSVVFAYCPPIFEIFNQECTYIH